MALTFQQDVHQARKNRIHDNMRRVQRVLRELAWFLEAGMNEMFRQYREASVEDRPALQMEHDRLEAARYRLDKRSEASIRKRDERLQALVPEERRASRKSTRPTQRSS